MGSRLPELDALPYLTSQINGKLNFQPICSSLKKHSWNVGGEICKSRLPLSGRTLELFTFSFVVALKALLMVL